MRSGVHAKKEFMNMRTLFTANLAPQAGWAKSESKKFKLYTSVWAPDVKMMILFPLVETAGLLPRKSDHGTSRELQWRRGPIF